MRIKEHRRHAEGYVLRIQADENELSDLPGAPAIELDAEDCATFHFGSEPPEGVTRGDYEKQQQREAALLVGDAIAQVRQRTEAGTKVKGEGQTIDVE
jgi:hypothetical protein